MIIKINIRDDTTPLHALNAVKEVIQRGRVSKGRYRKLFTYASIFGSDRHDKELVVITNDTKSIDCFEVYTKDKR